MIQLVNYGARITQVCVMPKMTLLNKAPCSLLIHVGNSEDKNVMVQGRARWGKNIGSCIVKVESAQVNGLQKV